MASTNQILVHEKIIVTPELKKKKKFYKLEFVLSVFLLCILFSYYIYAEYDRTKSEEVSKEILSSISYVDTTTVTTKKNEIIVVYLNSEQPEEEVVTESEIIEEPIIPTSQVYTYNGVDYESVATIKIPKINVEYPVLLDNGERSIDELLKISPTKLWGPNPNEVRKLLYSRT